MVDFCRLSGVQSRRFEDDNGNGVRMRIMHENGIIRIFHMQRGKLGDYFIGYGTICVIRGAKCVHVDLRRRPDYECGHVAVSSVSL